MMGRMALIFWSTAAHTIGMWLRHTAEPKFTQVAQLEEALHQARRLLGEIRSAGGRQLLDALGQTTA